MEGCGSDGTDKCHASELEQALNAQKLAALDYDPSGQKQKKNAQFAESILYGGSEFVASIVLEPADWAITIKDCASGDCSPWMLLGMAPFIPSSPGKYAGKYGDELIALVGHKGFDNFDQLKKYLGPAGDNMVWHHIVEQSQILRSGFSPQQVHNTGNVIAVDGSINRLINKIYSTNVFGPGSGTVRDALTGLSFHAQHEKGIQVLRDLNVIP